MIDFQVTIYLFTLENNGEFRVLYPIFFLRSCALCDYTVYYYDAEQRDKTNYPLSVFLLCERAYAQCQ